MPLAAGTRLGVYEITGAIGAGGMGEVYRARDTKLDRDVALKILPSHFVADPERVARFQREAKTLASLSHHNIGAIYGLEEADGVTALVLELVEGPTLADRIAQGPIPGGEALAMARQIAEALEAAHEQGIIHRDLKPANIKLRRDGTLKVLDFGLAKAQEHASEHAATVTAVGTKAGMVMGTPAYMSPEQARGEPVGRQADIWSFGVVLYEMLTGASLFGRQSTAETLASVLTWQPDYSALPSATPASARHLLRRCLQKDPRRRLQHMGDVRIEIDEALAGPASEDAPAPPIAAAGAGNWLWVAGAMALTALAGTGGWLLAHRSASRPSAGVVRLWIPGVEGRGSPYGVRRLAISDDGARVAYAASNRLWIRLLAQKDAIAVEGPGNNPFFSPNGDWVGFVGNEGLMKVAALGGTPAFVVKTTERPGGASWQTDGTILYATTSGLYQVSENGGEPRRLAKPDPQRKQRAYAWPQRLPDGASVLFTIVPDGAIEGAQIAVLDLKTLAVKIVLNGGTAGRYTPTGHLVYASGRTLKAVGFDAARQETRGDPVTIPDIEIGNTLDNGAAEFALSDNGTLVSIASRASGQALRTLTWVDRQGREEPSGLEPRMYGYARISPDGARVAVDISGANRDIWIWNLERPGLTKLTDGPTEDLLPVWSRDSKRVFFASNRTGDFDVYSQAADGATGARLEFAGPGTQMTSSMTPDGTRLLVTEDFKNISAVNLSPPARLEPILHSQSTHGLADVSPDGHWLAYESEESGQQKEIFVRPFPNVSDQREQVSLGGGHWPRWAPKGGELFYVDDDGKMTAVSVTLTPKLAVGRSTKLFDVSKPSRGASGRPYDISPSDGRFLLPRSIARTPETSVDISVVLNWFEELQQRAPPRGR